MDTNIVSTLRTATEQVNASAFDEGKVMTLSDLDEGFEVVDATQPYSMKGCIAIANYIDPKDGKRKIVLSPPGHTLLVGSTGSGKTQCFYLPQLELMANSQDNCSMLVMDIKGELYRSKAQLLREKGYDVVVLNGKSPYSSAKFNPLTVIWRAFHRAEDARRLLSADNQIELPIEWHGVTYKTKKAYRAAVATYVNEQMDYCNACISTVVETVIPITSRDPSWDYGAREIASMLLLAMLQDSLVPERKMTEEKFTMYNLSNVLNQREADCDNIIDYIRLHDASTGVHRLLNYYDARAKQTRDSFLMTTANHINHVVNNSTNSLGCATEIDVENVVQNIGKKRTAVFVVVDSTNKSTYLFCNLFLVQLMTELLRKGDVAQGGDFHVFWDEFANGLRLDQVVEWITTMRSRHVWLHLGVQSYQQLDSLYSAEIRSTIMGNAKTVFMGSNDYATLEELSRSLGCRIGAHSVYGVNNTGDVSVSVSPSNVPLVRVSDLAHLHLGTAYVKLFGEMGNKVLFTRLDPDFRCSDFSHGNADFCDETAYADYDIRKTYYHIKTVVDDSPKPKGWSYY